jgi:hypothetical protein
MHRQVAPGEAFGNRLFVAVIESANGGGTPFADTADSGSGGANMMARGGASSDGATASDPILSSLYADPRWTGGTFRINGQAANPTTTGLSGGVDIVLFQAQFTYYSPIAISTLGVDRTYRSGGCKYGEVINWGSSADSFSTTEWEQLEGYLAHKFGIASKLPGGHPYKLSPP